MSGSFAMVPAEVLATGNGHAIAVYAAIAQHANRDGEAHPSIARIQQITGWSKPTVLKALNCLCEAGVLVKTNRAVGGMKRANDYDLPLHGKQKTTSPSEEKPANVQMSTGLTTMSAQLTQDVNDVDPRCQPDLHEVEPVELEPEELDTPQPPTGGDDGFDQFWASYPRKVGKQDARKWWDKHSPSSELQTAILAAIAWQRNTPGWRKSSGEYIPHPTTWLNRGSWEDERPNNMVTLAPPKVIANPDYEGTYDPLQKFTPEAETEYHEQLIEAIARTDGISREQARERVKRMAA